MRRVFFAPLIALAVSSGCGSLLDRAKEAEYDGEYGKAEGLYRRAVYEKKGGKTAKEAYATFLVERGSEIEESDPEEAALYYRDALRVQPGHDSALTHWVRMLREAGQTDEAVEIIDKADAESQCVSCKRLRLVILLERGDKAMAAKKWDDAIEYYSKAQEQRRQAAPEMAISLAHLQAGRNEESLERLAGSVALVEADPSMEKTFLDIRGQLVTLGLSRDDVEIADRARQITLPGEASAVLHEMALQVADHLRAKNKRDEALERYSGMLAADDDGSMSLTAEQRTVVESRMITMYRFQIAAFLRDGKASEADAVLQKVLELRPDDMELRLQRLLVVSPKVGAEASLAALAKLPAGTKGVPQVKAALLCLRANERLDADDTAGAKTYIEQAEEVDSDLPEVHLATAELVAKLPPEDLSRNDIRALRRSLVAYGSKVRRYAEALGELDLAVSSFRAKPADYAHFTPWFKPRSEKIEKSIREVYPYKVDFRAEPEPLLVFENPGGESIELDLYGPAEFEDAYELLPATTQEVTMPEAGLLKLVIDGETIYFFAESYAKVVVRL